ncbi:MAG TPA: c-type cytochrome [Casimicrobiaceae bacterium]|nr:c-type cytochrome [Casimicrobiaceae bacterium]
MKKIPILLLAATMTIAGTAVADELEDMMKKNGCNACHAESKKVIGPSYVDVANKYKGDASAPAKLADKIKKGGSGVWGPVPMPPNPNVKDDDVKKMVHLILNLKK